MSTNAHVPLCDDITKSTSDSFIYIWKCEKSSYTPMHIKGEVKLNICHVFFFFLFRRFNIDKLKLKLNLITLNLLKLKVLDI